MAIGTTVQERLATLEAVCNVIGATEATVVEKAIVYMSRLHAAEAERDRLRGSLDRLKDFADRLYEED